MQASICLKRNEKLSILARVTKFFPFKSKCFFIKVTVEPQFTYCLLVRMLRRQVIIYDLLATPDRTLSLVCLIKKALLGETLLFPRIFK